MMGKLKELQSKMAEAQASLVNITASAESGGGLVKATANGTRKLVSLEIDESLLVKEDRDMLADLIVAAANKALDEAGEKGAAEIKSKTSGLLPNIPGMDLGNFSA